MSLEFIEWVFLVEVLALSLYGVHRGLRRLFGKGEVGAPNRTIDPDEIDNLISYIESESNRLRQRYASASDNAAGGHHDHAAHHGNH